MPAFTHFRPAQPVLVAHFFLAHVAPLRRDYGRLAARATEADALPLGSGAIAGTAYADRRRGARARPGFSRIVANSIDASSDRDFAATFLYACALTLVHLSRLAEDLIILCGDEHRFFELSDALSTGSSMMPQKKNPDPLELVRGKTGRAIGHLVALLTTMKGLPSGYNKDLQEDKQAVFDAEDTLAGSLAVVRSRCRRPDAQSRARRRRRHRACCSRPTSPTIWSAGACRSGGPTKSSARSSGSSSPRAGSSTSLIAPGMARRQRACSRPTSSRGSHRGVGGGEAHPAIDSTGGRSGARWRRSERWLDGAAELC